MGKKLLLLAAAALILPSTLRADSFTNFFFEGGTLTGSSAGLTMSDAPINAVTGLSSSTILGSNLGTVSFSTGPLEGKNIEQGAFLAGGNLTVVGGGTDGVPAGILFSGVFNQRSGWASIVEPDGTHVHVLHGVLDGTWLGLAVNDIPMEMLVYTQGESFTSPGRFITGSVQLPAAIQTPESGSSMFLAVGALGLAGAMFIKRRSENLSRGGLLP